MSSLSLTFILRVSQLSLRDETSLLATQQAFRESYKVLWLIYTGFGGLQLLVSLFIRDIPLHRDTDAKWDLSEIPKEDSDSTRVTEAL
jgi:hypothetical protein